MKYILVRNEKESEKIQRKLFSLGYEWYCGGTQIIEFCEHDFPLCIILDREEGLTHAKLHHLMEEGVPLIRINLNLSEAEL